MSKTINKIIWFLERLVLTMLGCSVVIVAVQVFARYVLRSPLAWTEQVARYLFIWMVMLGIPILFHRKIIISFDMLVNKLPSLGRTIVSFLSKAVICGFAAYYFWNSLNFCILTAGNLSYGIEIPLTYIYGAQPVCAFLLFFVVLNQIIIDSRTLITGKEGER